MLTGEAPTPAPKTPLGILEKRFGELRECIVNQQRAIGQARDDARRREASLTTAEERLTIWLDTRKFLLGEPAINLLAWKAMRKNIETARETIKALREQTAKARGVSRKLDEGLIKL